ncbi:MAG: hypothetical protein H6834_08460 [Planctomycetes bacterium]|nr:hypothetical protein [Planctomycetota bacterium]
MRCSILPILPLLFLTSCVDLEGDALWDEFREASPAYRDRTVEEILALKPLSSLPLRLGIAPPVSFGRDYGRGDVDYTGWRSRERELISTWCRDMQAAGVLSTFVFLPSILADTRGFDPVEKRTYDLRKLGARHRVDAILTVNALGDYGHGLNVLGILDLTILGMFVVPGHDSEAITVLEATLIDVRNEYVFVSGTGEGHLEESHALADLDPAAFLERSRELALEHALEDLISQVPGLRESWIVERRGEDPVDSVGQFVPHGTVYRTAR